MPNYWSSVSNIADKQAPVRRGAPAQAADLVIARAGPITRCSAGCSPRSSCRVAKSVRPYPGPRVRPSLGGRCMAIRRGPLGLQTCSCAEVRYWLDVGHYCCSCLDETSAARSGETRARGTYNQSKGSACRPCQPARTMPRSRRTLRPTRVPEATRLGWRPRPLGQSWQLSLAPPGPRCPRRGRQGSVNLSLTRSLSPAQPAQHLRLRRGLYADMWRRQQEAPASEAAG